MTHRGNHRALALLIVGCLLGGTCALAGSSETLPAGYFPVAANTSGLEPEGDPVNQDPAIAADGDGYFLVWENNSQLYAEGSRLYGSFLDRSGRPSLEPPFMIAGGVSPSIVWNGTEYVVAWARACSRWGDPAAEPDLYVGAWLPGGATSVAPHAVFTSNDCAYDVQLVQTDHGYLLAWVAGNGEIRLIRLDATLAPAGSPTILGRGSSIGMGRAAGEVLVAWISNDGLRLTEVSDEGQVVKTFPPLATNADLVKLAPSPTGALILARVGQAIDSFVYVRSSDAVVSSAELDVPSEFYSWAVQSRTGGFELVMSAGSCEGGCRSDLVRGDLDFEGRLVRTTQLTTDDFVQMSVALGTNGDGELLVWSDDRFGSPNIFTASSFGAPVTTDSTTLVSSQIFGGQSIPVVTHNDSEFVVLWNQLVPEDGTYAVFSRRVGIDGAFLDAPQRLGFGLGVADQMAIAFNGSEFLVVYGGVSCVRLDETGKQVGDVIEVGHGWFATVASDGHDFFVIWVGAGQTIYGARVTADGQVVPTGGFPLYPIDAEQSEPALDGNGSGYLAVWRESMPGGSPGENVRAVALTSSGTAQHSTAVASDPFQVESPALAWNGHRYLLVWATDGTDPNQWCGSDIHGRFLNASGDPDANAKAEFLVEPSACRDHWMPASQVSVSASSTLWNVTWFDTRGDTSPTQCRFVGRLLPSLPVAATGPGAGGSVLGFPLSVFCDSSSALLGHTRLSATSHRTDLGPYVGSLTAVLLHLDRARVRPVHRP